MNDLAIRVESLGKQYTLGNRPAYRTLGERVGTLLKPWARAPKDDRRFWALRDVSFNVRRGEVVGIIGRNGAGKSTLLKILSRITEPSAGEADLFGRVGSLLEVGTGFHPELTGRENIFLNGAILGMRRAEIQRKFDEIVAFAEVEPFIDTPVKHYSSGMYMRLAFAVAAHLEPEILVVDEVLAVGDAAFQLKCLGRLDEIAHHGRTVLFVSHNMAAVNRLCSVAYWLDQGLIRKHGTATDVVADYLLTSQGAEHGQVRWPDGIANPGETAFALRAVELLRPNGMPSSQFLTSEAIRVRLTFRVRARLYGARVGFYIHTADGAPILEAYDSDRLDCARERLPGDHIVTASVPDHLLNDGSYFLSVNAGMPGVRNLCHLENVLAFRIANQDGAGAFLGETRAGCILPNLQWQSERG